MLENKNEEKSMEEIVAEMENAANTAENAAAGVTQAEEITEPVETMEDYKDELEASFKRIYVGDMLTGTVIDVTEDSVFLDLKYYAEGIISKENLSNDPDFDMRASIHVGDEVTATVVKRDDGQGNIVLSRKRQ